MFQIVLLSLGTLGLESLLGPGDRLSAGPLRPFFFIIFVDDFSVSYFFDFGANLGSTWRPTRTQNPPKTVPRGLQIPSQLASCFEYPFLSILGASWVDFWWVLGLKLGAQFTKKSIIWPLVGKMPEIVKNAKFADSSTLLIIFWSLGRPTSKQNSQKSAPWPIKNQPKKLSAS